MHGIRAALVLVLASAPAAARAAPEPAATGDPAPAAPVTTASGSGSGAREDRTALLDALGSDDTAVIERAVAAIAGAPADRADPDLLYAAARACDDKLADPARALALYDRTAAEHPTARVTAAALRRAAALRALVGPAGETTALARELAQLIAQADRAPLDAVIRRGDRLADADWPGAPRAALWLADQLRRAGRLADADARYDRVRARWPSAPAAREALRGAAAIALDRHDWSRAEALARDLPGSDPADPIVRDDLLAAAARGRRRARWYTAAWLAASAALVALAGSLADAVRRGSPGSWRRAARPPLEVTYFGPIAAVLIAVAFTAHRLIAPAVATIALGGVALGWLSGAALDQLRAGGRPGRLRVAGHVAACVVGVAALAYIALTRDSLLDALIETVRFGPDP